MHKVIVNTTPLIALCRTGNLDILQKLYGGIIIPQAVYDEITVKADFIAEQIKAAADWIQVKRIQNETAKIMFRTQLHDGEVEVMILAYEMKADTVIIDDLNAKKHAKYLGLPVTGTLGVLIRAKQGGYIPALRPVLEKLVEENIYIKPSLIDLCLKQVGE